MGSEMCIRDRLVLGVVGGGGFTAGRLTAPAPPAEVRFVHVPAPAPLAVSAPEEDPAPLDPVPVDPVTRAPLEQIAPPAVEPTPLPQSRPKVEAKPEPRKSEKAVTKKPRTVVSRQRRPTAKECEQMHAAGRMVVKAGGRLRGYSDDQIDRALRDCGL